jgi:hypothetical protein
MALAAFIAFAWTSVETIGARRQMADKTAEQHCEQGSGGDCKSLEAEIRSAVAAEAAGDIAVQQLWISFIGLIAIGATVIYARAAWRESRRAVQLTEEHGRIQLRAYVHPSELHLKGFGAGEVPFVSGKVQNFGSTPATDLSVTSSWAIRKFPRTEPLPGVERSSPRPPKSLATLGAGDWVRFSTEYLRDLPTEVVDTIRAGGGAIYVIGAVQYTDVFGKTHRETFYARYGGDTGAPENGEMVHINPDGEESEQ